MDDREAILGALPGSPREAFESKTPTHVAPAGSLREAFAARLFELGGQLIDRQALNGLVAQWQSSPIWVDPAVAPLLGLKTNTGSIWEAEAGLALAKGAIAETGALIFESGPEADRLTTLAPSVNVAVVRPSTLVATLVEGLETVKESDRNVVFVTGPSRTADIEGIMIRGVHGPGKLLVCFWPD